MNPLHRSCVWCMYSGHVCRFELEQDSFSSDGSEAAIRGPLQPIVSKLACNTTIPHGNKLLWALAQRQRDVVLCACVRARECVCVSR